MSMSISYYYSILFPLLLSTVLLWFFIKKPSNKLRPPPSPPALPILGHLHLVGAAFPNSFQTLARRYGPLMQLRIGSSTFVVASSATVAREIFKTHDLNFSSRFESGPTDYNIYKGTGFITGQYGAYWRFMRKLCVSQLFAGVQINRFSKIREQEIINLLKSLNESAIKGNPCDLNVEFENFTNNIICKMTMGKKFKNVNGDEEAKKMRKLVSNIMESGAKLGVNEVFGILKKVDIFGHGKKLKEALWEYDRVIEEIMKDYEENSVNVIEHEQKDVLDVLLMTYRDINAEVKLTRNQIKHFILELFMASIDTQAAAIQSTMAELINHPKIFKKLRDEINLTLNTDKRLVNESDVPNLPYLKATVKESLRLHTPTPIIHRESTKTCKINGYDIKSKSKVLVNAYAIMRDPDTWQDPNEYKPERFLVKSTAEYDEDEMEMRRNEFSYLVFGGGRRVCPGESHAYTVLHATIAALVQCFDWEVKDGQKIDINVSNGYSGTLAPPLICYPITHFIPF